MDLFIREQQIYDSAVGILLNADENANFDITNFGKMVEEYGKLLRQFKQYRQMTSPAERRARAIDAKKNDVLNNMHFDVLTGIFNKRYLDENMEGILHNMGRTNDSISLMKADIDFFKQYNDMYGHAEGDVCLRTIAETLKGALYRSHDFAVRFGGEEFVIVLPHTNEEGARLVADRIVNKLNELKIPHDASPAADYVTMSIGLVTADKNPAGWMPQEFFHRVDEALFQAKNSGRNRYTYLSLSVH